MKHIKKGPNDVTRFIKRVSGGNVKDVYEIDEERIKEEEKYDGYYAVATNLDDDAAQILEISSKRYKIEECFRIMKTNFSGRPVYHHTKEHITAHFMICYTALLVYRLMEKQLEEYCKEEGWLPIPFRSPSGFFETQPLSSQKKWSACREAAVYAAFPRLSLMYKISDSHHHFLSFFL